MTLEVGFIGLGNIGKPCAKHLIREGFVARVFDIDSSRVQELSKQGAMAAETISDLASKSRYVGVCVRDDVEVENVLYGIDGVFSSAAPATLVSIHSTIKRSSLLKWVDDGAKNGISVIDAAISGGAHGAESGTLCYMVGGSEADFRRAKPIFETSADQVIHAGEVGSGLVLKLCNNMITYAEFMAMSEAVKLAEAAGIDFNLLRQVGRSNGIVNDTMHQFISNRNEFSKSCSEEQMEETFGVFGKLGEKDLDCALSCAAELGLKLPSTKALHRDVYELFMNKY